MATQPRPPAAAWLAADVQEHLRAVTDELQRETGAVGALVLEQLRSAAIVRGEAWRVLNSQDANPAARREAATMLRTAGDIERAARDLAVAQGRDRRARPSNVRPLRPSALSKDDGTPPAS